MLVTISNPKVGVLFLKKVNSFIAERWSLVNSFVAQAWTTTWPQTSEPCVSIGLAIPRQIHLAIAGGTPQNFPIDDDKA